MKSEKLTKFLKVFIIVLICVLAVVILFSLIVYDEKKEPLEIHECIKIGNFCSETDIHKGVEVEIEVSKGKKERFYVISNTEIDMTLIMNKNIAKQQDWHMELTNTKGPGDAFIALINKTKNWTNIDVIQNYEYSDEGLKSYITECTVEHSDPNYDCTSNNYQTRGYKFVKINKGEVTLGYNLPQEEGVMESYTLAQENARARLITTEEINNVTLNKKLPKWLVNDLDNKEGYWTMSSSVSTKTSYNQGAIAMAKIDSTPSLESVFVIKEYDSKYKIGIRPVIKVNKTIMRENPSSGH